MRSHIHANSFTQHAHICMYIICVCKVNECVRVCVCTSMRAHLICFDFILICTVFCFIVFTSSFLFLFVCLQACNTKAENVRRICFLSACSLHALYDIKRWSSFFLRVWEVIFKGEMEGGGQGPKWDSFHLLF